MKIVSTSYSKTARYSDPQLWLDRISFYTVILEELAIRHQVKSIERISHEGMLKQKGVDYHFIDLKQTVSRLPRRMHLLIKSWQPDVVLVNGFIFPMQIIQLRHTLGDAVKIIVLHRSEKPFRGLKKRLQQLADRCVDAYLFSSADFYRQWAMQGIIRKKEKMHEVMQASSVFQVMDKKSARAVTGANGSPVLLWVGRLDANKDPLTVIRAFRQYCDLNPGATLYMIYQSEELLHEVSKLAKECGNIQLVGKIPRSQLQYWYNSADFFVSASNYEGGGIALVEALSCGCIPVVTNIPSFRAITGRGRCGFLFEPGDEKGLSSVLGKIAKMNMEQESEKAKIQFISELSARTIALKIEKIVTAIQRHG